MLFMAIVTYESEKRSEVIKRRAEQGPLTIGKIIGEWSALAGGRAFRVIEADDPKVLLTGSMAWSDLCKIEFIPIMATEEVLKLASSKKQ
jgi:hypothetical protein